MWPRTDKKTEAQHWKNTSQSSAGRALLHIIPSVHPKPHLSASSTTGDAKSSIPLVQLAGSVLRLAECHAGK